MEQKKPLTHITAGLLIAAILIILSLIVTFLDMSTNKTIGWLTYLIQIVGLVFLVRAYGNAKDNRVSFGDLFAYGFKTTAVYTVLFIFFLIILNLLIPGYKEQAVDIARAELEKQDNMSDEQIEQGLAIMKKFYWVSIIAGTLIFFLIIGAIGSLIGAAVTKKRPNNPFEQLPS